MQNNDYLILTHINSDFMDILHKYKEYVIKILGDISDKYPEYFYEIHVIISNLKANDHLSNVTLSNISERLYYLVDDIDNYVPDDDVEIIIFRDPEWAFKYVRNIIGKRYPKAEPFILRSPQFSYHYAKDILKERWIEGEESIKNDISIASAYLRFVDKFLSNEEFSKLTNKLLRRN